MFFFVSTHDAGTLGGVYVLCFRVCDEKRETNGEIILH